MPVVITPDRSFWVSSPVTERRARTRPLRRHDTLHARTSPARACGTFSSVARSWRGGIEALAVRIGLGQRFPEGFGAGEIDARRHQKRREGGQDPRLLAQDAFSEIGRMPNTPTHERPRRTSPEPYRVGCVPNDVQTPACKTRRTVLHGGCGATQTLGECKIAASRLEPRWPPGSEHEFARLGEAGKSRDMAVEGEAVGNDSVLLRVELRHAGSAGPLDHDKAPAILQCRYAPSEALRPIPRRR